MTRAFLLLFLSACTPAAAGGERMESFELNGYQLTGAEYWPYSGTEEIRYPEDVLWGFYPEKGVWRQRISGSRRVGLQPDKAAYEMVSPLRSRRFTQNLNL